MNNKPEVGGKSRQKTVLVVENQVEWQNHIERVVREIFEGVQVFTALNAQEALVFIPAGMDPMGVARFVNTMDGYDSVERACGDIDNQWAGVRSILRYSDLDEYCDERGLEYWDPIKNGLHNCLFSKKYSQDFWEIIIELAYKKCLKQANEMG